MAKRTQRADNVTPRLAAGRAHSARSSCVQRAGEGKLPQVQGTWRDEECSPQLPVSCDIPDLLGHVDSPAGHRGDPAEVQDPGGKGTGRGLYLMSLWPAPAPGGADSTHLCPPGPLAL